MRAILLALVLTLASPAWAAERLNGRAHVLDGDTIAVGGVHVRLSGVAAPELEHEDLGIHAEAGGEDATAFMRRLVESQTVVCDLSGERTHERRAGICYRDGQDIGAELIKAGLARECLRYSKGRYTGLEPASAQRLPLPDYCTPRTKKAQRPAAPDVPLADIAPAAQGKRKSRARKAAPAPAATPQTLTGEGANCGSKRYCKEMGSCEEARFHLEKYGLGRLDSDGDGTQCENLC